MSSGGRFAWTRAGVTGVVVVVYSAVLTVYPTCPPALFSTPSSHDLVVLANYHQSSYPSNICFLVCGLISYMNRPHASVSILDRHSSTR